VGERLAHVLAADVGNALEGQVHVNWMPRLEVIFDGLNDQFHQIRVQVDQHGDE